MREVVHAKSFKKDLKREMRGQYGKSLKDELGKFIGLLAQDLDLPSSYKDYQLIGKWKDYRDCYIFHDLILIYSLQGESGLILVRLGSRAELNLA